MHSFCFECISSKIIVGKSNYCPACLSTTGGGGGGGEGISLGVNPFLDKKIITDGRKNHLCQTFREMLEEEKEGEKEEAK